MDPRDFCSCTENRLSSCFLFGSVFVLGCMGSTALGVARCFGVDVHERGGRRQLAE